MGTDPYKYFRVEAREIIDALGQGILALANSPTDPDLVARLLRLAHTIKGAARVVRQREIAELAHGLEDAMAPLRAGAGGATRELQDELLRILDEMAAQLATLATPPAEITDAAKRAARPDDALRMLRADVDETDAVLDGAIETHALTLALRKELGRLSQARQLAELIGKSNARVPDDTSGRGRALVDDLAASIGRIDREATSLLDRLDRELQQVRSAAERLRLAPVGGLFTSLERVARDAAVTVGKRVSFHGDGGDVRLDAQVIGIVHGALVQLVGNAVAHGIEPEAQRRALGKPAEGRVRVEVIRRGRSVALCCSDDGAGVDLDAVRRVALDRGVPADQVRQLDADAVLRMLFRGGISTASRVTEVSGRGVGLDVVREAAATLGGEITVHTQVGRGTTIELLVPITVSSVTGLLIEADGWSVTIPLDGVRRTLRLTPAEIARTMHGESVIDRGNVIPFVPLSRMLAGARAPERASRPWSAVVVEGPSGCAAIGVDRLLGTAEVVVRPLPELAPTTGLVAGASTDPNGALRLVLDPEAIVQASRGVGTSESRDDGSPAAILVVDDSLTTRMLERSILESAGYRVEVATSGEEALHKAAQDRYALFLVDVEMPGMDGFTFIERIRTDPRLRDIPALLVTSRASPEDVRRGEQAGAQGHIAKNEFDQKRFLERIRELTRAG